MLSPQINSVPRGIVRTGLACHYDAGDEWSWPGSGQVWRDLASGLDLALGATTGAGSDDPTFTGPVGGRSSYWSMDGLDCFIQAAAYAGSILRALGRRGQPITVEAWLYRGPVATATEVLLASQGSSGGVGINYCLNLSGKPDVYFFPGGHVAAVSGVPVSTWSQVGISGAPDGVTGIRHYLNGADNGGGLPATTWTSGDSDRPLQVSKDTDNNDYLQAGSRMAILRIYSRALTAAEMRHNWLVQRSRFGL